MTKRKNNKRALILSALSLLLCVSMLVGSTMAWFTDNATVSANKVQAGTLDISLAQGLWTDGYMGAPDKTIDLTNSTDPLIPEDILWEPGYLWYANLIVKNNGSLAAKVKATLVPVGEVGKLAEVIDVYTSNLYPFVDSYGDGKDVRGYINGDYAGSTDDPFGAFNSLNPPTKIGTLADVINGKIPLVEEHIFEGNTEESEQNDHLIAIALKMQETAGNDYQGKEAGAFDIVVQAAQATVESDSFDNQYDKDAEYGYSIAVTAEDIANLNDVIAKAAKTSESIALSLAEDVTVSGDSITIPEGVEEATINLNGKTIHVEGTGSAATDRLFQTSKGTDLVITGNGTIDFGDSISSIAVGGYGSITIENGTFIRDRYTDKDSYHPLIENTKNAVAGTKFVINGGYFDSGYYNLKEDDTPDCFNNCRQLINSTWSNCDIVVYGGTFVGANPAWGDEGMAHLCTVCGGNTYCQQLFLAGQNREDTELPAGYTITEGALEDGRPTFTVSYTAP